MATCQTISLTTLGEDRNLGDKPYPTGGGDHYVTAVIANLPAEYAQERGLAAAVVAQNPDALGDFSPG